MGRGPSTVPSYDGGAICPIVLCVVQNWKASAMISSVEDAEGSSSEHGRPGECADRPRTRPERQCLRRTVGSERGQRASTFNVSNKACLPEVRALPTARQSTARWCEAPVGIRVARELSTRCRYLHSSPLFRLAEARAYSRCKPSGARGGRCWSAVRPGPRAH